MKVRLQKLSDSLRSKDYESLFIAIYSDRVGRSLLLFAQLTEAQWVTSIFRQPQVALESVCDEVIEVCVEAYGPWLSRGSLVAQ